MATSIYQINKGINRSIEFKGLKAQYIWYLGGGILCLLFIFVALYIIGISRYICMGVILPAGSGLVYKVYGLSNKYGEHGMMKEMAKRSIPKVVRINSRKIFIKPEPADQNKKV
jgi:hypothetical protein